MEHPQIYYRSTRNSPGLYASSGTSINTKSLLNTSNTVNTAFNLSSSKETGRVEKGSHSAQTFGTYQGDFYRISSQTIYYKILPYSEKPFENKDLVMYCVECGTKNKSGKYKFCPTCGNKF
jgi:hypothetical protein